MTSTLVLLSGGVDSLVVAETLRRAGQGLVALHFDYDQPAKSCEQEHALAYAQAHSIPFLERQLILSGMDDMNAPRGLSGPRVVPARNLVFIANAANIALSRGLSAIAFGANQADIDGYADCRASFVRGADAVCEALGVRVHAPLIHTSKADIIRQAKSWGLVWWSCYTPTINNRPCGTCNACVSGQWTATPP